MSLCGLHNFTATDRSGNLRYVYVQSSKWDDDDLKAYLELLSVIVEKRFNAASTTILGMELRTGTDMKWKASPRMRNRCADTARLYARLQSPK
jgi:hypothetical protein